MKQAFTSRSVRSVRMPLDTVEPHHIVALLTEADLERLVRTHSRRLHNFIHRRVGNIADVEDLMQDTCLEALRCLGRFQGASRPETWLFGIALNLVRGHYKRAGSRPVLVAEISEEEAPSETFEDPVETVERFEEIGRLSQRMEELSPASVSVLTLVFDERLTYEQAAHRLHIPVGTVRSRIARARAVLKKRTNTKNDEGGNA
jgi:RNA polymerase sigma factor (sigma-70 family)